MHQCPMTRLEWETVDGRCKRQDGDSSPVEGEEARLLRAELVERAPVGGDGDAAEDVAHGGEVHRGPRVTAYAAGCSPSWEKEGRGTREDRPEEGESPSLAPGDAAAKPVDAKRVPVVPEGAHPVPAPGTLERR